MSPLDLLASSYETPITILRGGFLISVWAGVVEEIYFRWIGFLGSIVSAIIFNYLLGGFMGYGLIEILHMYVFGPVADFTTLGYLHDVIFHPTSWAVGVGMLGANAMFRDGHSYQGFLGYVHSWFFGMMMFYLLFEYGIISCMVIHFAYKMTIFTVSAFLKLIKVKK